MPTSVGPRSIASPSVDWTELRAEIAESGERVAMMLREAPDAGQQVVGSEWSVAELGAHLVTGCRRQAALAEGADLGDPYAGDARQGMVDRNAKEILELEERDPDKLAAMLVAQNEDLLAAYGQDGDRAVRWWRIDTTIRRAAGIWLGELLVHGLDLARTLDRPWPLRSDQAAAIIDGIVPILPRVARREVAARAAGTYHIRLRGGGDYTLHVDEGGSVRVEDGRPERADLHVSADPLAYLLVGYGRRAPWRAILTGKIRAMGRKPWLARHFTNLFEQP